MTSSSINAMLSTVIFALVVCTPAFPQANLSGPWSGKAQWQISVQGPGYSHQETQTWTLNGASSTMQGAKHVFPANWSVTGQGSLQRSQGTQTLLKSPPSAKKAGGWDTLDAMSYGLASYTRLNGV